KQVSVNKKAFYKKEQREKFIWEASEDSSTKCFNTMGELGSNSLDVCLKQSVRSYDFSAVKMETTFSLLYEKLLDAEDFADRVVQEVIIYYCQFGKALIQRRSEIASKKQVDPESNAVSRILNMKVRAQLPADTSDALLWKRIEQAKKLWKLFDAISMDKIYRIHSFSVSSISKMTYKDIQYIIDNMPVDYSIKIESSTCAQPKDTLLSDEKNSELSHPDIGSESDKKNS
ncbi:3708_t:CDS:1, partial [Funneliformis mosseae]